MKLDINNLKQLKGSNDFEYIKDILIRLKHWQIEFSSYQEYQNYLRLFLHYRLFMKTDYICDTELVTAETNPIDLVITKAINRLLYCFEDRYATINEIDMTNNCSFIAHEIKDICNENGLIADIIEIYPGYVEEARLFGMQGWHYANIIHLKEKKYLVDLSYKQFFKKNFSFLEEIGVEGLCAPLPGVFMLMDIERRRLAEKLLKTGYIELKGNNLKLYCDGFTISYRNGMYYRFIDNSYSTDYSNQDYLNFLIKKSDNQLNHEPIKCLGPLKQIK